VKNSLLNEQVGNLSAHTLQFRGLREKKHRASKYSDLIFERFIGVFGRFFFAKQKMLIYCIIGKARKV
jgi:hypothetical protein